MAIELAWEFNIALLVFTAALQLAAHRLQTEPVRQPEKARCWSTACVV